jgi:hypothetical protein
MVAKPSECLAGVLLNDYSQNESDAEAEQHLSMGLDADWMPRLKLDDGREVKGYECWWIPKAEVATAK